MILFLPLMTKVISSNCGVWYGAVSILLSACQTEVFFDAFSVSGGDDEGLDLFEIFVAHFLNIYILENSFQM